MATQPSSIDDDSGPTGGDDESRLFNINYAAHRFDRTCPFQRVCVFCERLLCPSEPKRDPTTFLLSNTAQTDELYQMAVRLGCYICSLISQIDILEQQDGDPRFYAPLSFMRPPIEYGSPDDLSDDRQPIAFWVASHPPPRGSTYNLLPEDRTRRLCLSFIKAPQDCFIKSPATLDLSTGSMSTLETSRQWLKSCSAHHDACNRRGLATTWCPTRLLDLGEPESTSWTLCIVQEDGVVGENRPRYMTLSYRWAREASIILTRESLDTFRQGLHIADLPLLFRQVISVVKFLGLRYLWIDALCIVQDWTEDWEREATMMHLVYANSACNIAASAADGPHESLFRDRDQTQIEAGLVEASLLSMDNVKQSYVVSERHYYDRQLRGPLQNRGWVMQERFLAPRVLYFGSNQVVWECLTKKASEVFPLGQPGPLPVKHISSLWNFNGPRPAAGTASISDELLSAWIGLIKEYASCQLTYPTDKIFAMTGMAQVFAEVSGDLFVVGMWKTRISSMFDWWLDQTKLLPRPAKLIAPSFSWASVDGSLLFFRVSGYEELVETLEVILPSDTRRASLRVRGRMFMISRNRKFSPRSYRTRNVPQYFLTSLLQARSGTKFRVLAPSMWSIIWDTSDDRPPDDKVAIVLSRRRLPDLLTGIVLVRCNPDTAKHEYRRVGFVRIRCDDEQFERLLEVEPTEFTWI